MSDENEAEDENSVRNANDRFFQGLFGIDDASRGFLEPGILQELSESLDWQTAPMEAIRGLFVSPRLRYRASDLLWKVRTREGEDAFVCISFDHQSRPDKWMALRFLGIQVLAWDKILGEDEGKPKSKLPVIYSVLLYQGEEPWNAPLEFQELVNFEPFAPENRAAIGKFVPNFRFQLISLQNTLETDLPKHPLTRLGLTLMRAAVRQNIANWVREHRDDFTLLLKREDSASIFRLMFNYAAEKTQSEAELDQLNDAIDSLDEPTKNAATMNGAQILEARGEARGEAKGLATAARRLLDRGIEPETVCDMLNLPLELVQSIANGQEPDLVTWAEALKNPTE